MFLTKVIAAYTLLAIVAKATDAFGFGDVPVWFVMLPFLLALCEPASYLYQAWKGQDDDDDVDPSCPANAT